MNETNLINPIAHHDENDKKKHPEFKQYLLLLNFKDEKMEKTFEILKGRSETYLYIRSNLDDIIITKSYVLVEDATLEEMITVYEFMIHAEKFFPDSNFNIDDYIDDEYDEFEDDNEEETSNNVYENDPEYNAEKSKFEQSVKQNSIEQTYLLFAEND